MKRILLFLSFIVSAFTFVSAETIDLGILELDKEYALQDFKGYQGKFTAPASGILTCSSTTTDDLAIFSDAAFKKECAVTKNSYYGPHTYDLTVEKGKTYYFYIDFVWNSGTVFKMTMAGETKLTLESSSPAVGSAYSVSNGGQVSFDFNKAITFSGATLTLGDKTRKLGGQTSTNSIFFNDVKSVIWDLISDGTAKVGDEFTITITNISMVSDPSIKYGTDGTLKVDFTIGKLPIQLVSSENTSGEFLSYYAPGNEEGLVKLTFDGKVSTDKLAAQIKYGSIDADADGGYYVESLIPTISEDGTTVIVNLQGKSRNAKDMVSNGSVYDKITLGVTGVMDEEGNYAYSAGSGSLGSYWFEYTYKEVKADIFSEFTPADGSNIDNTKSIEIWVSGENMISYSGIEITYEKDGQTASILVTDYQSEDDPDDETAKIFTVKVPAEVVGARNIKVTFKDLVCADGKDHSKALTAEYNVFRVKSITPAKNSRVKGIAKGDIIKLKTTMDSEVKGIQYEYIDATEGKSLYTTFASTFDETEKCWTIKNYSNAVEDFLLDHVIKFVVKGYDEARPSSTLLGTDTVTWIGDGTAGFEYSDVKVLGISPTEDYTITSINDNRFEITFSAPVEINKDKSSIILGQMTSEAFESITPNYDKTLWTLTISKETLATISPTLRFNIYARDAEGRVLEGNTSGAYQMGEKSYYKFSYICHLGSPDLTITPAQGQVESLKDFTIGYDGGISLSYAQVGDIVLRNTSTGSVVETIPLSSLKKSGNSMTFSLSQEVTENGQYELSIPDAAFALGTEFDGIISKAQTVKYSIGQSQSLELVSIYPAPGSSFETMPNISVTLSDTTAGYVNYRLYDKTIHATDSLNSTLMAGDLKLQADGTWATKWLASYEIKLYAGHTYCLFIKAYHTEDDCNYGEEPLNSFSTEFFGATLPYKYSEATLVRVTPESGSAITTGEIVAEFSAPVQTLEADINAGMLGDNNVCAVSPSEDYKTWTITIPSRVIDASTGGITMNVYAKGADGKIVQGNFGEDEDSYFVWEFNCYNACPVPQKVTPADGSTVEKISVITIEDEAGINLSYLDFFEIAVTKGTDTIQIAPMTCTKVEEVALGATPKKITITLPEEITEPGTYQIHFPAMYFMIGEQFESLVTKDFVISLNIADTTAIRNLTKETKPTDGKYIENGRIIIIRNGMKYSISGSSIK